MKKTTIICVMALLCLNFCAEAQEIKPLKIGDRLPETFWQQSHSIYNNAKPAVFTFKQAKGKAILLDFWATWCSACLKGFPKMDALKKQYAKHLQIMMVNTHEQDTHEVLVNFYKKQEEAISGFALPLMANDKELREMFPIKSIPHYIWIGADGRIKAITDADAVTETQVKRLIAGLTINLKLKER